MTVWGRGRALPPLHWTHRWSKRTLRVVIEISELSALRSITLSHLVASLGVMAFKTLPSTDRFLLMFPFQTRMQPLFLRIPPRALSRAFLWTGLVPRLPSEGLVTLTTPPEVTRKLHALSGSPGVNRVFCRSSNRGSWRKGDILTSLEVCVVCLNTCF